MSVFIHSSQHAAHLLYLYAGSSSYPSRQENLHHQPHSQLSLPGGRREVSHLIFDTVVTAVLLAFWPYWHCEDVQCGLVTIYSMLACVSSPVSSDLMVLSAVLQGSATVGLSASGLGGDPYSALHPPRGQTYDGGYP